MRDQELFLGKSLEPAWCRELTLDDQVTVASPYLTPALASRLFDCCDWAKLTVLTTFAAENFSTGASSLGILRILVEDGRPRVVAVPRLHAKIVCTRKFATIGSQNLTGRSGQNIESSVALCESRRVRRIQHFLNRLIASESSFEITLHSIAEMERLCAEMQAQWRELSGQFRVANQSIAESERRRREEGSRARKAAELVAARQAAEAAAREVEIRQAAEREVNLQASKEKFAHAQTGGRRLSVYKNGKHLVLRRRENDPSLLRWSNYPEPLVNRNRYLVYEEKTGIVSWMRLNEREVSLFEIGLRRQVGGLTLDVVYDASYGGNVKATIRKPGFEIFEVNGWFDGVSFRTVRSRVIDEEYGRSLIGTDGPVSGWIERQLVRSFVYKEGSKTAGKRVDELFGVQSGRGVLRLVRVHDHALFVLDLSGTR